MAGVQQLNQAKCYIKQNQIRYACCPDLLFTLPLTPCVLPRTVSPFNAHRATVSLHLQPRRKQCRAGQRAD